MPDAELLSLAVAPEARGSGVADTLYRNLVEDFQARGVDAFRIIVGEGLAPAHRSTGAWVQRWPGRCRCTRGSHPRCTSTGSTRRSASCVMRAKPRDDTWPCRVASAAAPEPTPRAFIMFKRFPAHGAFVPVACHAYKVQNKCVCGATHRRVS
ncbi:GNAT family N-acetyltransferase [Luteimonas qiangzhengi]